MFSHDFKYKVKYMLRDKSGVFWMIVFPFLLAMFFYLSFGEIMNAKEFKFEKINIAIINYEKNKDFVEAAESSELFIIEKLDRKKAEEKLSEKDIKAIIDLENSIEIQVLNSGTEQSTVKYFVDKYLQISSSVTNIFSKKVTINVEELLSDISKNEYIDDIKLGNNGNEFVIYFYALISMTCIFGATLSVTDIEKIQANQSNIAIRNGVSPINKIKMFLASILATILFHYFFTMLSFLFMRYILKVEFGEENIYIFLICLVSIFCGTMIGAFVCTIMKSKEGLKVAILIAFTLICSFFAGLNNASIKYAVDKNMPIINKLNPVALTTDSLYSLYYYENHDLYFRNLFILLAIGVLCTIGTFVIIRRQKYGSV